MLNSIGEPSVTLVMGWYSIQLPCSMLVCVGGTKNRSNSDFVHSQDCSWAKAITRRCHVDDDTVDAVYLLLLLSRMSLSSSCSRYLRVTHNVLDTSFYTNGTRFFTESLNDRPPIWHHPPLLIQFLRRFLAFWCIFIPCAWKNGSTKRLTKPPNMLPRPWPRWNLLPANTDISPPFWRE